MRVVLVGTEAERARLRAEANGSFLIAGEFPDLASARSSGIEADAFLVAQEGRLASAFPGKDEPIEPLTDRELQVLGLLAEGLSNKAIASRLGISDQTVKFHVASISGKLGAHNRTEAVRLGVRRGLIAL
jgi:DNA-binding NarL/FixJ family response regulator